MTDNNQSISFEIQRTLPILPWTKYPSNPFARHVTPVMLSSEGLQVIDTIGSRNSVIPATERGKAVYVFDQSFVVASIEKIFNKLQCESTEFMALCSQACNDSGDDSFNTVPLTESDFELFTQSQDELATAKAVIQTFKDELATFRAILPTPNDNGEYPVRYIKAILMLEKLENILGFECDDRPPMPHETLKAKVARL
jgi:hypothetical protein